jgi:hypothetical protein
VITLPQNSVTLSGSASDVDGSIATYQWSKVSGGSASISTPLSVQTTITALVQGSYVFRLTVTDNSGATSTDDVALTVNGATTQQTPTRYLKVNVYGGTNPYNNTEWNNWNVGSATASNITSPAFKYSDGTTSSVSGILSQSQAVGDNNSNYKGGMAPAEVLRYTSYSSTNRTLTISGLTPSKLYDIELYASRYSTGNSTIFTVGSLSQTIATYDNFTNKARFTSVAPNAQGQIVVQISKTTTYSYLNGFTITEQGADYSATATAKSVASPEIAEQQAITALQVFPNPFTERFTLQINNSYQGKIQLSIIDITGNIKKQFEVQKNETTPTQFYLSAGDISAGTYILKVQMGTQTEEIKIIKQ